MTRGTAPNEKAMAPAALRWRQLVLLLLLACGAAWCAWLGGWVGSAATLALAPAALWLLRAPRLDHTQSATGDGGAQLMVKQVVPVWSRQLQAARVGMEQGVEALLNAFAALSTALNEVSEKAANLNPSMSAGASDDVFAAHPEVFDHLLQPVHRAIRQRDAAVAELAKVAAELTELSNLAKEVRGFARHTRLVALNASIEANRMGRGDQGAQAVATEVRNIANRSAETGEAIEIKLKALTKSLGAVRRDGEVHDTGDEELRLEVQNRAREALTLLLGNLGQNLQATAQLREASLAVQSQVEALFMGFQFGDRASQMLDILNRNLDKFVLWVAAHQRATHGDALAWLQELEASYTTEEQRTQHHGNVDVRQSASVDFF